MKKRLSIFILVFSILISVVKVQAVERLPIPTLRCENAILIDAATGNVLYQKNADKKAYPASTTKILTTALALELKYDNRTTTVSSFASKSIGIDGSNANLKPGEKLSVKDLLNMALIVSANDAANAIAEAVSGNRTNFVALMNKKVKDLGLKNTSFLNPIGLDVEDGFKGHMTTAHDLAVLMRYATSFGDFRSIIGKASYQPPKTNIHTNTRPIYKNTDLLIVDSHYKSSDYTVMGGKTGYTKAAQNVFVGNARNKDGIELIVVLMKNPDRNRMFDDAKSLFDYGFDLVKAQPEVAAKGFYDLRYRASENDINDLLRRGILAGNGSGAFDYASPASKEMFVKVLMDIRGVKTAAGGAYWSKPYLDEALGEGLINQAWFSQRSGPITRGEVIQILGKLIDLKFTGSDTLALAEFIKDYNSLDDEMKDAALEVCALGIVPYLKDGTLSPGKTLTREELMMILCRYEDAVKSGSIESFH